jgi:1-acyl-sn-glycerol-3-phosphate acyltransferase
MDTRPSPLTPATADPLAARDPAFVRRGVALSQALGKHYFRWQVRGVEHVPQRGAAILVGNHNGGLLPLDSLMTIAAIYEKFGERRAVHPLVHDLVLRAPVVGRLAPRFGALRASPPHAHRVLEAERLALVYPGSDLESNRPWTSRGRIDLGGRKGFVKIALRTGAPIVPVVSAGTHEQFFVLARGRRIARLLRLKSWVRSEVFPIIFAIPWGLCAGCVLYWPLPAQTSIAFGPPIRFDDLGPDAADDEQALEACYRKVASRMQEMLDDLCRDRIPLLGVRRRGARGASRPSFYASLGDRA